MALPITVRNLLQKKRYAGVREYQGAEYPAVWPAVFDTATWKTLQLTLRQRREARAETPAARRYLLTPLVARRR
jgi:hypothetical protein